MPFFNAKLSRIRPTFQSKRVPVAKKGASFLSSPSPFLQFCELARQNPLMGIKDGPRQKKKKYPGTPNRHFVEMERKRKKRGCKFFESSGRNIRGERREREKEPFLKVRQWKRERKKGLSKYSDGRRKGRRSQSFEVQRGEVSTRSFCAPPPLLSLFFLISGALFFVAATS